MALLVVREMSDETFHSVNDLQDVLGLPVLAAVPERDPSPAAPRAPARRAPG